MLSAVWGGVGGWRFRYPVGWNAVCVLVAHLLSG